MLNLKQVCIYACVCTCECEYVCVYAVRRYKMVHHKEAVPLCEKSGKEMQIVCLCRAVCEMERQILTLETHTQI